MANKSYLCTCRDLQIEWVHDFLLACRVTKVDIDKLNFAFLDNFQIASRSIPHIKSWLFIDDREDIDGSDLGLLYARNICYLSANAHIGEEKNQYSAEHYCLFDTPWGHQQLCSKKEDNTYEYDLACCSESIVKAHFIWLFDYIIHRFD